MDHRLFVGSALCFSRHLVTPLLGWALLLGMFPSPVFAAQTEPNCQQHYRKKEYLPAGDCYQEILKQARSQKRNDFRDLLEDRYLRNAAICYAKAADLPQHKEKQAVFRNRAANLLMESFRSGSCKASGRCESNRNLAERLFRQIKAAPLVVLTGNEDARISIKGPEYTRQALGKFSDSVLPGTYQVEVNFPSNKKRTETVTILPDIGRTLNVSPDKIRVLEKRVVIANKVPPLIIGGYIAGGVLLAASIAMMVYGPVEQTRLNALLSDPATARTISDEEFNNGFNTASTVLTVGIITAAVGAVVIGASAIGHVFSQSYQKESVRELPGLSALPPQAHPTTFGKSSYTKSTQLLPTLSMP
ncbi:MAG: hypothetical protein H6728_13450 [Myxococcales bacterium]|nr:hypothetical protein [Myxococcales bacterium]